MLPGGEAGRAASLPACPPLLGHLPARKTPSGRDSLLALVLCPAPRRLALRASPVGSRGDKGISVRSPEHKGVARLFLFVQRAAARSADP